MELTAVRYGIGATAMEPTFDPTSAAKYFTIAAVVYILASGVSKVGVGLVLYRLASVDMRKMRLFLAGCITVTAVWFLGGALVFGLQCRPLAKAWDLTGTAPGSCMSASVIGTAGIAISAGDVFFTTVFAVCISFLCISFFWKPKREPGCKLTNTHSYLPCTCFEKSRSTLS